MPNCLKRRSVRPLFGPSPVSNDGTLIIYQVYTPTEGSSVHAPTEGSSGPDRTDVETKVAESVRHRIDNVVTAIQRRAILRALGCFEPQDPDSVPGVRRAKVPRTAGGAELLAAIDALDHACLQGSDEEIEATGARLIELWKWFR
jgi:hypothetical protein